MNWTRENLAWAAGLLEGDGCFTKNGRSLIVSAGMTDLDVLERLRDLTGLGTIRGPHKHGSGLNIKPMYYWQVNGNRAYALMVALYPWMRSRRRARILELMGCFASSAPHNRSKVECIKGHRFTEENTYLHRGRRHCRECRKQAVAPFNAARKVVSA